MQDICTNILQITQDVLVYWHYFALIQSICREITMISKQPLLPDVTTDIANRKWSEVYISLGMANTIESQQKILSEIFISNLDHQSPSEDLDNLIYLMTTIATRMGCIDSIKKCLPYYLPIALKPFNHLISNAVRYHQKNTLEWLLGKESPFPCEEDKENVLYQAAGILINQNNHNKVDKETFKDAFFDIVNIIFNDEHFNPNYLSSPRAETLLEFAMNKNSLYFLDKLLQHPRIDLSQMNPSLQKRVIENHLLHNNLPKWRLFNLAYADIDTKNEIMKYFCRVACPSMETWFAKNPYPGLFAKNTDKQAKVDSVSLNSPMRINI